MGAHTTIRQQRPAQYSQQKAMEGVEFEKRPAGIRIRRNLKRKADCKQSTYQDSTVQIFGSKLQDVFRTFSQNNYISFFRLKVIK